jgi:hypothetical protein
VPFNDKLYRPAILFRLCRRHAAFNAVDVAPSLMHAPSRTQARALQVVPSFFVQGMMYAYHNTESDFGTLGVTATLCGTETALAQHTAALPSMKTIGTPAAPAERATPNSE